MDLEMTGLEADVDKILQIATVVTDTDLNIVEKGPEIIIFQDEDVLVGMNDWCQEHHKLSGLTDKVRASKISTKQAEKATLDFIKKFTDQGEALLCGNSIHQDRNFLSKHMPMLHNYLHYRNIDVSSIKELSFRWFPDLPKFEKASKHTAMEDILESIDELKYYRENIFR